MIALLLQGAPAPPALPAGAPWWSVVILAAVPGIVAIVIAFIRRKRADAPGAASKTQTDQGAALADLRARLEKLERTHAPGSSQVRAALARISALEGWRKERDQREERRLEQQHQDDLKLERILARIETKLEGLEQEECSDRRSRA